MERFLIQGERVISAPRQAIFDLLADPRKHSEFDGSGTVQGQLTTTHDRLKLGAVFGMQMRKGINYRMRNTVIEFEEGARIAWKPAGNYVWRYVLEDAPAGTRVIEQWDARRFKLRLFLLLFGVPKSTKKAIEATLERIALLVEQ